MREVKSVSTNYSNLVINTLIAIQEKEKRRIIDLVDIKNYKGIFEKKAKEKGIEVCYHEDGSNADFLKEHIYYDKDKHNYLFGIKPCYRSSVLYDSRDNLPFDLCILFCDNTIASEMPNRHRRNIERLNAIDDAVTREAINVLTDEWDRVSKQASDIELSTDLEEIRIKIKKKLANIYINRKI